MVNHKGSKIPKSFWKRNDKFIYVICIDKARPDGKKKQWLGPYAEKHAESVMLDCLKEGYCAWIEKSHFRDSPWRSKPEEI